MLQNLYKGSRNQQPKDLLNIWFYAEQGDLEKLENLIGYMSDINYQFFWGRTLFHYASMSGQIKVGQWLIDKGINTYIKDSYGWTGHNWISNNLSAQLIKENPGIQKNVLQKLQVNQDDLDLYDASELGYLQLASILVTQNKKLIDCRGAFGRTPLHLAVICGHETMCQFLLEQGANPSLKDNFNLNPIQYAQKLNRKNINAQISKIINQRKNLKDNVIQLNDNQLQQMQNEVIILGAGAAGIGAGRSFLKIGIKPLILEAQDIAGGRARSENFNGYTIDLGGQWIHSYNKNNSIYKLLQELGGGLDYRGAKCQQQVADEELGLNIPPDILQTAQFEAQNIHKQIIQLSNQISEDMPISKSIKNCYDQIMNKYKKSPCIQRLINLLLYFNEQYEGASFDKLSTKHGLFSGNEPGGDQVPLGGYGTLMQKAAQDLNIKYNQEVQEIDYQNENSIAIKTKSGEVYQCKKLIVSLPLGILQNMPETVQFRPELSAERIQNLKLIGNGLMDKIFLRFEIKFWDDFHSLLVAFKRKGKDAFFLNLEPYSKQNILCMFMVDNYAEETENLKDEQIIERTLTSLRTIFGDKVSKLLEYKVTRWKQNKYSMGSYSHFATGSSIQTCLKLSESIQDRIFFAGEYLYFNNLGTVAGAYTSGQIAAQKIQSLF
ncbi:Ankyrin repeat-containing domain [Pseudocohnilembus persalinus]|uniref:Ankyrin repeat-containing domain n=1 Tax=Pseudocohnilembus persalinus TaxID=266149 RepID=A0A0V0QLW3_PSEPJ|nr:Ankyrin repeat-containing domain [Pseudocohnilembus persalinus]|eukprot:KRX03353.1 Ankyrin repeat-containing domain [Pseudocohnilembus persalinus]